MRFHHLAKLFYDWGWSIPVEQYVPFSDYVKEMIKRERVVIIKEGEEILGILFFFITDDHNTIYKKSLWACPKDQEVGREIYVDKLVCKKITPTLWKKIQATFEEAYPDVVYGIYHRSPYDRCVKTKLGVRYELQNTVSR